MNAILVLTKTASRATTPRPSHPTATCVTSIQSHSLGGVLGHLHLKGKVAFWQGHIGLKLLELGMHANLGNFRVLLRSLGGFVVGRRSPFWCDIIYDVTLVYVREAAH